MQNENVKSRHNWGIASALWVIAVLLAVLVGLQLAPRQQNAMAQTGAMAGARGVYAFTGQIGPDRYGLFMLDVDQGTIWCYEVTSVGSAPKLRLVAARAWIYDRYLQSFNTLEPDFRQVQELVARERQAARALRDEDDDAAPPTSARPDQP